LPSHPESMIEITDTEVLQCRSARKLLGIGENCADVPLGQPTATWVVGHPESSCGNRRRGEWLGCSLLFYGADRFPVTQSKKRFRRSESDRGIRMRPFNRHIRSGPGYFRIFWNLQLAGGWKRTIIVRNEDAVVKHLPALIPDCTLTAALALRIRHYCHHPTFAPRTKVAACGTLAGSLRARGLPYASPTTSKQSIMTNIFIN
jgi:hypothetical protein